MNSELDKIITDLKNEFAKLRSGRAGIDLVAEILVEVYNSKMPLNQLATLSAPEARLIVVQPWDKSILKAIESSIRQNFSDLNPIVDGEVIRLPFPAPTEEKRKDLVKESKKIAEEARVRIRRFREESLQELKSEKDDGKISEDDFFQRKEEVQAIIDKYNKTIGEMEEAKEQEIMSI